MVNPTSYFLDKMNLTKTYYILEGEIKKKSLCMVTAKSSKLHFPNFLILYRLFWASTLRVSLPILWTLNKWQAKYRYRILKHCSTILPARQCDEDCMSSMTFLQFISTTYMYLYNFSCVRFAFVLFAMFKCLFLINLSFKFRYNLDI